MVSFDLGVPCLDGQVEVCLYTRELVPPVLLRFFFNIQVKEKKKCK